MKKCIPFLAGALTFLCPNHLPAQDRPDFPQSSHDDSVTLHASFYYYNSYGRQGKLDSCLYYGHKLEQDTRRIFGASTHAHASIMANYLGYVYLLIGNIAEARHWLQDGLAVFDQLHDTTNSRYADALFFMGLLTVQLGQNTQAADWLLRASPLEQKFNRNYYAQSQEMLISVYANTGDYEQSIVVGDRLNEMLDTTARDAALDYYRAAMYNNLAITYVQTGNSQKSLSYLKKAVAGERTARTEGYPSADYFATLLNEADGYLLCDQPDSAFRLCNIVEDSLRHPNDPDMDVKSIFAQELPKKALILQHRKKFAEATALMHDYVKVCDSLPTLPHDYYANLVNFAILYTDTREFSSGDSLFRQIISRLQQSDLTYSYELQQAIVGLCANLLDQGKYSEASDTLINLIHLTLKAVKRNFSGLSENDQFKYISGLTTVFDLLYTCLYNQHLMDSAILSQTAQLQIQRQSLLLAHQINFRKKIHNTRDTAGERLYYTWLDNRELLSAQFALPKDQRLFNTDSLEGRCEELEKKISLLHDKENTGAANPYLLSASPRSASISFVRFRYQPSDDRPDSALYAAFVYTPGSAIPAFVHLCSEKTLLKLLRDKNGRLIDEAQLTQDIYDSASPGAVTLYRLIWQPLQSWLHGIDTIHYTTAGLLNNIAFDALYSGKTALCQKYVFHRHLNLQDQYKPLAPAAGHPAIYLWGNMHYATHPPLGPAEISAIKDLFREKNNSYTSFEGDKATEENFKDQAANIRGVLHISTHGFYKPFHKGSNDQTADIIDPLFRCGLAFSGDTHRRPGEKTPKGREDGILTGYEAAQLDFHGVKLITLSACETGLGDITDDEGNLGLQRAFKLAGADNLLVSLWQVPAKQTAELLILFYRNWLEGQSLSMALHHAERTLQKKNYPAYYWAGFVLIE
jgi:CHAT domain-containing protein/tetratricopeptide (TPR) repeat protein